MKLINFDFLSEQYPIQKAYMAVPHKLLLGVGLWPFTNMNSLHIVFNAFNAFCLGVGGFSEYGFVFTSLDEPLKALDCVCPASSVTVTFFKYLYLWYYRKEYRDIINECKELFFADKEIEQDKNKLKIVSAPSALASVLSFGTFMFAFNTNLCYCVRPLVTMGYQLVTHKNITMIMPFSVLLPETLLTMPEYPVTYAIIAYSGLVTVIGLGGIDGSCTAFCLYVAAMFETIQYDLKKIFEIFADQDERQLITEEESHEVRKKLNALIQRHNDIMDMTERFRSLFTFVIFGHFFSAAITICCGLLDVMLGSGYDLLIYVFYVGCVLSQLFIYCYGGTRISYESEKISEAAYFSHWYRADPNIRKMITIIMARSQKPVLLSVPFFSPSLPAFSSICGTAGSYITLLKTFI